MEAVAWPAAAWVGQMEVGKKFSCCCTFPAGLFWAVFLATTGLFGGRAWLGFVPCNEKCTVVVIWWPAATCVGWTKGTNMLARWLLQLWLATSRSFSGDGRQL